MKDYENIIQEIKKDNVEELDFLYKRKHWKDSFFTNYETFIDETLKSNSLKCLDWLMTYSTLHQFKDFWLSEMLDDAITSNNKGWLDVFFSKWENPEKLTTKEQEVIQKNKEKIFSEIDYEYLSKSNDEIFTFFLSYAIKNNLKLYSHLFIDPLLENNNIEKLDYLYLVLKENNINFPIDRLIDKSLYYGKLDVYKKYVVNEKHILTNEEKDGAITSVAFSGRIDSLEYLIKTENIDIFIPKNAGTLIECALRSNKLDFVEYLLSEKKLTLYPINDFDRRNFIEVRKTMWEDMQYDSIEKVNSFILSFYNIVQRYEQNNESLVLKELKDGSCEYNLDEIYLKINSYHELNKNLNETTAKKNRVKI